MLLCSPPMSYRIFGEKLYLLQPISSIECLLMSGVSKHHAKSFSTRLISSIPLKLFGCPAFVHIPQQHQNKLDPKATKCIFLKYSINQKGYKCYFPVSKRFYNSMDVTFLENRSYYSKTDMQGENRIREY